jgi:hypothetical protein
MRIRLILAMGLNEKIGIPGILTGPLFVSMMRKV